MNAYDIRPTDKLSGVHMLGTGVRRFLINYAVPADALAAYVPPGATLSLFKDKAWVSACFVHMNDMRPSFSPSTLGLKYNILPDPPHTRASAFPGRHHAGGGPGA